MAVYNMDVNAINSIINNVKKSLAINFAYSKMKDELENLFTRIREAGGNFNLVNDVGNTILMILCESGSGGEINKAVTMELLECDIDLNATNKYNQSVLMILCRTGFGGGKNAEYSKDIVFELLKGGANPHLTCINNTNALLSLCSRGFYCDGTSGSSKKVVLELLKLGVSFNINDKSTALLFLCKGGFVNDEVAEDRKKVIIQLLKCGADPNTVDKNGITALILLSRMEHKNMKNIEIRKEIILELIYYGADLNLVEENGHTALMIFSAIDNYVGKENIDFTEMLIDNGGNVRMVNESGKTAKQLAGEKGKTKIVEFLQKIENKLKVYPLVSICIREIYKNHPIFKTKLINYPPLLLIPTNLLQWFRREEELRNSMAIVRYYK